VIEQASKVTLTSRAFRNDRLGEFYQKLAQISELPKILPMNSGAEAVETALKAVRKWAYQIKGIPENQAEIIVCDNNFAGRTIGIVSFSTEAQYQEGFGPFTPGFKVIPFGDSTIICLLSHSIDLDLTSDRRSFTPVTRNQVRYLFQK